MNKRFLFLFLLIYHAGFAQPSKQAGQPADQVVRPYILSKTLNTTNGLPQNGVKSLYFNESNGLLWIATQSGLVRYDGNNCKVYDADNLQNLASNRIISILPVVGGNSAYTNSDFSNYISIWGLSAVNHVVKFPRMIDGALCSEQQMEGLWKDAPQYEAESEWKQGKKSLYILPESITDFCVRVNDADLYFYHEKKLLGRKHIDSASGKTLILLQGKPALIKADLSGVFINPVTGSETSFRLNLDNNTTGAGNIFYNYPNQLFYQHGHDLFFFDLNSNTRSFQQHIVIPDAQAGFIQVRYLAGQDILLLGNATRGLDILRPARFSLLPAPSGMSAVSGANTTAQLIIGDSMLFTNEANLYNLTTNKCRHLSLPLFEYSALSKDRQGNIWFMGDNNIYRYNPATGKLVNKGPVNVGGDITDAINMVCYAPDEKLWFGTQSNIGYQTLRGENIILPQWASIIKRINGIGLFTQDELGNSYFTGQNATLGYTGGMYRLSKNLRQCALIKGTEKWNIRFIKPDSSGNCWIGTYGNGWYYYQAADQKMMTLPLDEKRYLNNTHAIIEDTLGYLWVTTNNGLFLFRKQALIHNPDREPVRPFFRYYNYQDGLPADEFNGGGQPIYNWWKGNLLLSCVEGITTFRPCDIQQRNVRYPVFVDQINTAHRHSYCLAITDTVFHFSQNERDIQWVLQKAVWDNPYGTGLEYRLDDEPGWQVVHGFPAVVNIHATGGEHVLHIRSAYGFRPEERVSGNIHFTVAKQCYEYILFWILLALSGGGIFYVIALFRTRRLSRRSKELEGIVSSRTQDLQDAYQQVRDMLADATNAKAILEKSNVFKTRIVSLLSHDLMTPLISITTVSEQLDKYRDLIEEQMRNNALHEINNTARQLVELCTHMLQWAHVQQRDGKLITTTALLTEEVQKAGHLLDDAIQSKSNSLQIDVSPTLKVTTDLVIFQHILLNLLSNANKFTSQGTITILADIVQDARMLVLTVRDTGIGMSRDNTQKLMQHLRIQPKAGTSQERGWGLGFEIINDLLLLVDGTLDITSTAGEGTVVTVSWKVDL